MSDILRWQERKTRKPHKCFGCGKEYPAGSKMVNAAYVDGGSVFSDYLCPVCEEYMRRNFEPGDETGYGEIYGGDPDGWNALKAEMEANHEK